MTIKSIGIAAVTLGTLSLVPSVRAGETILLAGVGSLSGSRDVSAPTITLKNDATTAADTIEVNGPIARGLGGVARVGAGAVRFAAGGPFFRYGYGYGRPWLGYRTWGGYFRPWFGYRPWGGFYRPWLGYGVWGGYFRPWGLYRPWLGYYRPWIYPGIGVNIGYGGYPYVAGYPSSVEFSSPPFCSCPSYAAPVPQAAETAPPPRPMDGYRYDGGPRHPTPAPNPVVPRTPPVPTPPIVDAVARRPIKKLEYPAYGESLKTTRPIQDPLLVKSDRSK
jgi:hypothetical protein